MLSLSGFARRATLALVAAVIVGGSVVGLAAAQPAPAPPPAGNQTFLAALAQRLNITVDALQQAITGARADAGLPADGSGFPGRGGQNGPGPRAFGPDLDVAAQAIGIDAQQLRQELAGTSLAAVAQAHGKSANDVIAALTAADTTRIDQAVSDGRITADQAAQRKQTEAQRLQQLVNQTGPQDAGRGPRPGDGRPPAG
jgi:hypothetical protein